MEEQVVSRAHRMGQTRPVLVETLAMRGTIEEQMLEYLQVFLYLLLLANFSSGCFGRYLIMTGNIWWTILQTLWLNEMGWDSACYICLCTWFGNFEFQDPVDRRKGQLQDGHNLGGRSSQRSSHDPAESSYLAHLDFVRTAKKMVDWSKLYEGYPLCFLSSLCLKDSCSHSTTKCKRACLVWFVTASEWSHIFGLTSFSTV